MMLINPSVVDLSHWDPADDYDAVYQDGIWGCIYKATEGTGYTDGTYVAQQQAAKAAGVQWGSYHFADASDVSKQIDNYLNFAYPDPDELFSLDWEDNGGDVMSVEDAKTWIEQVENQLGRPGQCVIYSGNTAKEALGDDVDTFFGERRLWLCHYSNSPTWQKSWKSPWLWQYTDGQVGPTPHSIDGIGPCDINSYDGQTDQLVAEWATGSATGPAPPVPSANTVQVLVVAPPGVSVKLRQLQVGADRKKQRHHEADVKRKT